nr:hypothetical protein [Tanacetum cinerariifolium]
MRWGFYHRINIDFAYLIWSRQEMHISQQSSSGTGEGTGFKLDVQRTKAEQLKLVLKRSRHETHISQQSGFGTGEGTGSKPGVPDVPSDDSEEELSWKSSDDEDVENEEESNDEEEQELRLSEEARIQEEEDVDELTPEESKEESNDEEDQDLRLSEEARIQEEEDVDELYRDININQGRGLHVTQNVEDTHVTLTLVNPDGPQESSSMSSFVSSMLNPISDVEVESIFTTTSSLIVSLETPTPIMTPSTIETITTSGEAPIPPPTIPSIILENLPTFNSAFHFEERLRLFETSFYEYRQTNQVANAVSAIPSIVHQYMADLSEMELKKILIEKMEGNKSIQRSDEQRNLYKALVEAYEADKAILDTYGESTILKRRREDDDQERPNRGSKRQKEGGEQASASTPSEKATKGAGGSTKGTQSRQQSASESAYAEEPVQTTCQMEETLLPVYETGAGDQPIVQTS